MYHNFLISLFFPDELQFSEWASWSMCSKTCSTEDSPSIQARKRKCYLPDGNCAGDLVTSQPCLVKSCPGDRYSTYNNDLILIGYLQGNTDISS